MALYLGIDTSNYTTSVAICDEKKNLILDERIVLNVKEGARGLRQSEAFFQHSNNLPTLLRKVFKVIKKEEIHAIGVSTKPRPQQDSYMPVFLAGYNCAEILAQGFDIPLIKTSHQEGHLIAGLWSCSKKLTSNAFNTIHISGGTTEALLVKSERQSESLFHVKLIGGTTDLHTGQFIDRVGVSMGMDFPAGNHLERLARKSTNPANVPVSVKDLQISFSGPESHVQRLMAAGVNFSDIARGVEDCILKTLEKFILNIYAVNNLPDFLLVGGVARNNYIRNSLEENLRKVNGKINLFFADPAFSSDNAVGISLITILVTGGVSSV